MGISEQIKESSRIAVIDCGTNTFHLLVADVKEYVPVIVYHTEQFVRLGEEGIACIGEKAFYRGLKTLISYADTCKSMQVDTIYAFGTAALRIATNSAAFLETVQQQTGIEIKVINGDTEAQLIYKGIITAVPDSITGQILIMDIGGGSTEFIIGDKHNISWKISLPLGASVLKEKFQQHDPLSADEIMWLKEYLAEQLYEVRQQAAQYKIHTLIGASGSFDTLTDIIYHGYRKTQHAVLNALYIHDIQNTIQHINHLPLEDILLIPGMKNIRADMMPVAGVLILEVINSIDIQTVYATQRALKDGLLLEVACKKTL